MLSVRVIPCLLLRNRGLVKTRKFHDPVYVGDPINAVRILNEKEVDELVFLDITATNAGREPDYELISDIAGEAFMPFAYGGGIKNTDEARKLFSLGVEKVIINTAAASDPQLISRIADTAGSQSVVASIDVKRSLLGRYSVRTRCGTDNVSDDVVAYAKQMEHAGAGELLITSIDRDGTMSGYDIQLASIIGKAVSIPVVINGGASSVQDMQDAVRAGASAVAAGSMFVFHGKHRAVLITYPDYPTLQAALHPDTLKRR